MFGETGSNLPTVVTGVFCEPFSAASAIAGLLRSGSWGIGGTRTRCQRVLACDWSVLLMVRVDPARRKKETKIAIELLKHYGGVCAVANNNYASMSDSSPARDRDPHRLGGTL